MRTCETAVLFPDLHILRTTLNLPILSARALMKTGLDLCEPEHSSAIDIQQSDQMIARICSTKINIVFHGLE